MRHHIAYLCHPSLQAIHAHHQDRASHSDLLIPLVQADHLDQEFPSLPVFLVALLVLVNHRLPSHPAVLQTISILTSPTTSTCSTA